MTREIDDGYVLRSDIEAAGGGGGLSKDAQESLADIQERVIDIDDRVHSLEAKTDSTPEEIKDLALSLVDALPRLAEEGTPQTAYVTGNQSFALQDSRFETQLEALTDWAQRKEPKEDGEWTKHDVRQALDRLANDMERVKMTRAGTDARYYMIDPDNPTEERQ